MDDYKQLDGDYIIYEAVSQFTLYKVEKGNVNVFFGDFGGRYMYTARLIESFSGPLELMEKDWNLSQITRSSKTIVYKVNDA